MIQNIVYQDALSIWNTPLRNPSSSNGSLQLTRRGVYWKVKHHYLAKRHSTMERLHTINFGKSMYVHQEKSILTWYSNVVECALIARPTRPRDEWAKSSASYSVNLYPAVIYTAWLRAEGESTVVVQGSFDFRFMAFLNSKQYEASRVMCRHS